MRILGRPYYSAADLESKSKKLLTYFSPEYFKNIKPTPLVPLTDFLKEKHKIVFYFGALLGFNNNNCRILGAFNPVKRVILIDSSLQQDLNKFNFTLAHELGHLALHRDIKIIQEPEDINNTTPTLNETISTHNNLRSDSEWIEWQANFYASALLMPMDIFKTTLINFQQKLGISKAGKIYIDDQSRNQKDYYQLIDLLSNFFHVSKAAVQYRLSHLKLVEDKRKSYSLGDFLKKM